MDVDDIELFQEIEIDQVLQELESLADRAEIMAQNPEDNFIDITDSKGRKKRKYKESTDDFLLDAELNVKKIASLMTETLDMMIEMQETGQ